MNHSASFSFYRRIHVRVNRGRCRRDAGWHLPHKDTPKNLRNKCKVDIDIELATFHVLQLNRLRDQRSGTKKKIKLIKLRYNQ